MNDSGFQVQILEKLDWIYRPRAADTVPLATTTIPARTPHERALDTGVASLLSPSRLNNSLPTRRPPPLAYAAANNKAPKAEAETREAATRRASGDHDARGSAKELS